MKARSLARELAVLAYYQLAAQADAPEGKSLADMSGMSLKDLTLSAMRAVRSYVEDQLQDSATDLRQVAEYIQDLQDDHPENERIPFDQPTKPVVIPTTAELLEKVDCVLQAADVMMNALDMPEILVQANQDHVQDYVVMLFKILDRQTPEIHAKLEEALVDWRLERLHRIDRAILELAVAEMLSGAKVDPATTIDEFIELAKRYASEDSYKLINGVLATVSENLSPVNS
jgi:transcription antitermination protein NusB